MVLTRRDVDRWLRQHNIDVLDPEQMVAVHEAARRSTTWTGK